MSHHHKHDRDDKRERWDFQPDWRDERYMVYLQMGDAVATGGGPLPLRGISGGAAYRLTSTFTKLPFDRSGAAVVHDAIRATMATVSK